FPRCRGEPSCDIRTLRAVRSRTRILTLQMDHGWFSENVPDEARRERGHWSVPSGGFDSFLQFADGSENKLRHQRSKHKDWCCETEAPEYRIGQRPRFCFLLETNGGVILPKLPGPAEWKEASLSLR